MDSEMELSKLLKETPRQYPLGSSGQTKTLPPWHKQGRFPPGADAIGKRDLQLVFEMSIWNREKGVTNKKGGIFGGTVQNVQF